MNELKEDILQLMKVNISENKRGNCITIFKFAQIWCKELDFIEELSNMYFEKWRVKL